MNAIRFVILLVYALVGGVITNPAHGDDVRNGGAKMGQDFVVLMTALPPSIDSRTVESASQYRLMRMLGRPLTGLSKLAEVEGDAASSWTIENDHRTYTFTIASGSRFSDGSLITADDVIATLNELRQKGTAVHFDFTSIVSIKALPPDKVRIELKAPNKRFINMVAFPEFSILHRSERGLPEGKQTHAITSGPYRLASITSDQIVLEKNQYYKPLTATAPSRVVVIGQDRADAIAMIRAKQIDFLDFFLRKDLYDAAKDAGYGTFLPRMAHTSFVSINSHRPHFATRDARRVIQVALSAGKVEFAGLWHKWEPALELYLPGGPGRLSDQRLAR
jgi:peptide/nickel transport system substrate-binding protein